MGQATPIRVRKLVRIEVVSADDVVLAYEVDAGEQLVIVMNMPAFRDAATMHGSIVFNQ